MKAVDQLPDAQQLDQLLAEADAAAALGKTVDSTVQNLRRELETMAKSTWFPDGFKGFVERMAAKLFPEEQRQQRNLEQIAQRQEDCAEQRIASHHIGGDIGRERGG